MKKNTTGLQKHGELALLLGEIAKKPQLGEVLATGTLCRLWDFAQEKTKTYHGGISDGSSDEWIVRQLGWPSKCTKDVIAALVNTKWLDVNVTNEKGEVFRLYIHDWHEHSENAVDKWLSEHGMCYANGKEPRRRSRTQSDAVGRSRTQSGGLGTESDGVGPSPAPRARAAYAYTSASTNTSACASSGEETLAQSFPEWAHGVLVETGKFPELTVLGVAQECQAWKGHPAWGSGREAAIETCAERARCMPGAVIGSPLQWLSKNLSAVLDAIGAQKNRGAAVAGGGFSSLPAGMAPYVPLSEQSE